MKINRIVLFLILVTTQLSGQDFSPFNCQVKTQGILKYPFTGGFSAPQFSNMDINLDGIQDLFVFDRIGDVPMFFEYEGQGGSEAYNYNIDFKYKLPDNMCCWALARDYNGDGLEDIFSVPVELGVNGMALYQSFLQDGELQYVQRKMGGDPEDVNLIWYDFANSTFPVTVPFNDLPDIVDVDFDGDLDVLSFDLDGSYIAYFKNMQVEKNLPADTMEYKLFDICFGKIMESGMSENIFLSSSPSSCANGFDENQEEENKHLKHSGSTVLAFDNDDDMDMDLIIGDLTNTGLYFLENGGSATQNYMTSLDVDFPVYDLPVEMSIFLGAFNVDVDGDNLKDLIVAPNQKASITNTKNTWLYKNTGDKNNRFAFNTTNFLGEQTLDFGSFSHPVFVDYNMDGKMDIVVSTDGEYGTSGPAALALYLFENTGTPETPAFELKDDDYLDFRAYTTTSRNPSPAFGDLDGDKDIDLLIGDNEGKLYFFENIAGPGMPLQFKNPIYNYMGIDIGQDAKPEIADINGDGLGDIILGTRLPKLLDGTIGTLLYFQNSGTLANPNFDPDPENFPNTPIFGEVDVRISNSGGEAILSQPCLVKNQNKWVLLVGSDSKGINLYSDIENNTYNAFTYETSNLGGLKEGRAITVDAYDIDKDGFLELLIGNRRGGISFYNSDIESETVSTDDGITTEYLQLVYPNPVSGLFQISYPVGKQIKSAKLINSLGMTVAQLDPEIKSFDSASMISGVYYLVVETESGTFTQSIIKI